MNSMLPANAVTNILHRRDAESPASVGWSWVPFVLTWTATAAFAHHKLFPILSGDTQQQKKKPGLPLFNKDTFKPSAYGLPGKIPSHKLAATVFSASIGLSTVLVELLLCEISNTLNPVARSLALRVTLSSLLVLSILVTPALELHGLAKTVFGTPDESTSTRRTKPRIRLALEAGLFLGWLLVFWYLPQTSILRTTLHNGDDPGTHLTSDHAFTEACLERVGIIGISLMASLAGFAAVSSLWQTFGVRHRNVRDTDIARKAAGLEATKAMLEGKQSRLRAFQRKMSEAGPPDKPSFMGRMIASIRDGSSDTQEAKALQMEVAGLETMRYQLSTSLSAMRARYVEQQRARTTRGKVINVFKTSFALYCAYRIFATSLSSLRRYAQPNQSFATSDPINNVLALLTTYWDPTLDRAAWSRQISFLLSGVMLLASFNAVLQTFRLFARFAPSLLQHTDATSLPLIISQVAGTYVISSALLLRSNLPEEMGGVISDALGAPLEARFVDGWFESWFLVAVGLTATGILVGRKVGGGGDEWDGLEDEGPGFEMGKRN
ncbi:hypothetical protein B0A54_13188 [Friedmanniomyces endolithicus]|uniref:Abscisic acid G-protein coupled receptor-like domain-containing protein n=1 Tax=Friedmanniomyces endolithicus TaxID=329885 RepID=A0A4U0UKS7_9PEZI|nr:hypothetical protein LTS09_013640 [Friedmanniomyces endolithicus]KAK0304690.1 hypothetical protein LTR01_007189 [Friedmanniomyces endolithicus]KAK0824917.1 hypothetical protein LTR73_007470 [Friedmanniomyces endolithicus]TKA36254.1 hypothetical protein B0A54_13188 [Friedmanniomyces endolithicus]